MAEIVESDTVNRFMFELTRRIFEKRRAPLGGGKEDFTKWKAEREHGLNVKSELGGIEFFFSKLPDRCSIMNLERNWTYRLKYTTGEYHISEATVVGDIDAFNSDITFMMMFGVDD